MTPLTEEQMDQLAKHLAPKLAPLVREELEKHFYTAVGRSVTAKFFYVVGLVVVGLVAWLSAKGLIKW